MQMPDHVRNDPERQQKYFLNSVAKNNGLGFGPWVTKTKRSLLVKIMNFAGKSMAL